ncbi:hypothetical protein TSTA_119420 [Talaromyces stipitatus ATCC 10500]|uniref:Zn(2)-C6 fungal-type domain-containing protein n=1 Tax=Talaromyces stipitatus (strain ATCC 10500 / CBS 375.48 / QM 6759 / NRRL 1006) TaxID=441959 RepID=B8MBP7_TALSN|nr:uncharacterized protein TSTA_119420 [Talaromyces stipitatus ATCC 10500]EED18180.1 hypothetical protein TSTA_119420 [Talaromyces stipitatus ATCC 10500]
MIAYNNHVRNAEPEKSRNCDRKNPCTACLLRGSEDECEYARTDEDRYHISQAKEIENLRKELNRLKRKLEDGEQKSQSQSQAKSQSYGSTAEDYGYGGVLVVDERPNKRRFGEEGNVTNLWNLGAPYATSASAATGMAYSTQPEMAQHNAYIPMEHHPQHQQYYQQNTAAIDTVVSTNPLQYGMHQLQQHRQPDFWRGKQEQLETIYKIVCDCDEYWVPSIIDIVRNSLSPEDAIVSIRSLLRSGSSRYSYSNSNSNNSNDGGTVMAASTITTTSDSQSPDSASSMIPVNMDSVSYVHVDCVLGVDGNLPPTDQYRSSGEG